MNQKIFHCVSVNSNLIIRAENSFDAANKIIEYLINRKRLGTLDVNNFEFFQNNRLVIYKFSKEIYVEFTIEEMKNAVVI